MADNPDQPCAKCGATPTAKVRFTKEQGMLLARRTWWVRGSYCQECGLRVFTEYQAFLKARGWWHLAGPIRVPMAIAINKSSAKKLRELQPPMRTQQYVQR